RVSTPLSWEEVPTCEAEAFTISTVPKRFAEIGDPGAGIDAAVGSLDALLELSREHEAAGEGDAPWPPNYRKQEGEPPRVQPSRQRRTDAEYDTPEAEAQREKSRAAVERRIARAAEERASFTGSRPTPTGRRRSSIPVVEIARAAKKDEAQAGLDRWKSRHRDVVAHLRPADVLVDSMRGRSTTWTRIRVNLQHVPPKLRPKQGPQAPDYDVESEWFANRTPEEADKVRAEWRQRPSRARKGS